MWGTCASMRNGRQQDTGTQRHGGAAVPPAARAPSVPAGNPYWAWRARTALCLQARDVLTHDCDAWLGGGEPS
eukprot:CAMPEP_0171063952 /NCGR_PEP_ID=MMETSP0766_2-20121228/5987_1 /TAXON_ID=439317 /ORGANISM="Gambierdiscus australes, Strain CAWD 149" /LENGTH=72 /DNA_ID=CAMNT_0011519933 /DNA_START=220 /DNA_END=438 /DNA_ORIENTATION=+